MTAPLPSPYSPLSEADTDARASLQNTLEQWAAADLRRAIVESVPLLDPGQLWRLQELVGLWAQIASRAADLASDGNGCEAPGLGGGISKSPQRSDSEPDLAPDLMQALQDSLAAANAPVARCGYCGVKKPQHDDTCGQLPHDFDPRGPRIVAGLDSDPEPRCDACGARTPRAGWCNQCTDENTEAQR